MVEDIGVKTAPACRNCQCSMEVGKKPMKFLELVLTIEFCDKNSRCAEKGVIDWSNKAGEEVRINGCIERCRGI